METNFFFTFSSPQHHLLHHSPSSSHAGGHLSSLPRSTSNSESACCSGRWGLACVVRPPLSLLSPFFSPREPVAPLSAVLLTCSSSCYWCCCCCGSLLPVGVPRGEGLGPVVEKEKVRKKEEEVEFFLFSKLLSLFGNASRSVFVPRKRAIRSPPS